MKNITSPFFISISFYLLIYIFFINKKFSLIYIKKVLEDNKYSYDIIKLVMIIKKIKSLIFYIFNNNTQLTFSFYYLTF